jgi:hypothetical protein
MNQNEPFAIASVKIKNVTINKEVIPKDSNCTINILKSIFHISYAIA